MTIKKKKSIIAVVVHCCLWGAGSAWAQQSDLDLFFDQETLVESVTRHPKPLVQVAENVAIVTAAQIQAMHAHTLYEVLNRVPGFLVIFNGGDFGSDATLGIHGQSSEDIHRVTVLLDGIRINTSSNGKALLNGIPVSIIKRLEIIKGPASSTWGSAIGGVINIITKEPARNQPAGGSIGASYGEADTRDLGAEINGATGSFGYYLFGGNQHSDGLLNDRYFDNNQVYAKSILYSDEKSRLVLSGGYHNPEWKSTDLVAADSSYMLEDRLAYGALHLQYDVSDQFQVHLDGGFRNGETTSDAEILGTGLLGRAGDDFIEQTYDDLSYSFGGRCAFLGDNHTVVSGVEVDIDRYQYRQRLSPLAAALFGMEQDSSSETATAENYGIYLNDTIRWDLLTLSPGIRYDYNSISGGFLSPSLGATMPAGETTRLRLTMARGFSSPLLALLEENNPFISANPNLKPEEIWSIQGGVESKAIPYLLLKSTVFYHNISEIWLVDRQQRMWRNGEDTVRRGIEFELETAPIHGLLFASSLTYTVDDPENGTAEDFYKWLIRINYTNPVIVDIELFGSMVHFFEGGFADGEDRRFLWDLSLRRSLHKSESVEAGIFVMIHNLTDEAQYWSRDYVNPGRWFEAGLRITF